MSLFWLGVIVGGTAVWALGTLTLVAIRSAEHGTPMAADHWPLDDEDEDEDELDAAHRRLIETDGHR